MYMYMYMPVGQSMENVFTDWIIHMINYFHVGRSTCMYSNVHVLLKSCTCTCTCKCNFYTIQVYLL